MRIKNEVFLYNESKSCRVSSQLISVARGYHSEEWVVTESGLPVFPVKKSSDRSWEVYERAVFNDWVRRDLNSLEREQSEAVSWVNWWERAAGDSEGAVSLEISSKNGGALGSKRSDIVEGRGRYCKIEWVGRRGESINQSLESKISERGAFNPKDWVNIHRDERGFWSIYIGEGLVRKENPVS